MDALRPMLRGLLATVALFASPSFSAEWLDISPPTSSGRVAVHPMRPNLLLSLPWRSEDGGRSWSVVRGAPSGVDVLFVHRGRPGVLFAHERRVIPRFGEGGGRLFTSIDFGATWSALHQPGDAGPSVAAYASDPASPQRVLGVGRLAGGCSTVYCFRSAYLGLFESFDEGRTWSGLAADTYEASAQSPADGAILVSLGSRIAVSKDGGHAFMPLDTPFTYVRGLHTDPSASGRWYVFDESVPGRADLWRTDDAGRNWRIVLSAVMEFLVEPELVTSTATPGRLLVAGLSRGVHLSEDWGDTWRSLGPASDNVPVGIAFSAADPDRLYVHHKGRLLTTTLERRETLPAVEYYIAPHNRFWMTTNLGEAEALDYGAEPGASRTGEQIRFWRTPSGLSHPSCRFQGNPASGLHTRFITLEGPECSALRTSRDWILEGFAEFWAKPVEQSGCPEGSLPVTRFLKRGADLNHRYTTTAAAMAAMDPGRWIREGVAMCAAGP